MEELSTRLDTGPELVAALEQSPARLFSRADYLVATLIQHADRERVRLLGGALARPLDADRGELELALTAMQLVGGRIAET